MMQRAIENTENSLDKIKRQLASASGRNLLQGPLLKRSETVINFDDQFTILCYFCFIAKIINPFVINLQVSFFIV